MKDISVVLLAYSEEENLRVIIPRIVASLDQLTVDYEILVIDGLTQTDQTEAVCRLWGASYIQQEEPHYGGAFRTGIKHAQKERLLVLDVDGSHEPEAIPSLVKESARGYDLVIGSRYTKGGTTHDALTSKIMSFLLNNAFRIMLGIKAKDISTSFRIYKTNQLKKLEMNCKNFDVLEEAVFLLKLNNDNFSIKEVPIAFNKRIFGQSKRRLLPFIMTYIATLFRLFGIRVTRMFSA